MDLTLLSDALPYSTRYNSKIKKENVDLVMFDACMKNRNVTSVAMAGRSTEAVGDTSSEDAVRRGRRRGPAGQ